MIIYQRNGFEFCNIIARAATRLSEIWVFLKLNLGFTCETKKDIGLVLHFAYV